MANLRVQAGPETSEGQLERRREERRKAMLQSLGPGGATSLFGFNFPIKKGEIEPDDP